MRRFACGTAVALVAALAARSGFGGVSIPVITEIRYENGLTGMAEHAGFNPDGTGGGRHVTIILNTPASEVMEVRFNDVDVNDPGLAPVVTDRFVPASDTEVDALGNSNPNAIRVEVPPRLWPLDARARAWPDLTSVTVLSSAGESVGANQSDEEALRGGGGFEQLHADASGGVSLLLDAPAAHIVASDGLDDVVLERFRDQIVSGVEVVSRRTQRHTGLGGDAPVSDGIDTALGDHPKRGGKNGAPALFSAG